MQTLTDFLIDSGDLIYYDTGFRQVLEDHLYYLRSHPQTTIEQLDQFQAYKYSSNLNGLLQFMRVPYKYHWLICRLNGYNNPSEFTMDHLTLVFPNFDVVERIRASYMTKNIIKK